MSCSHVIINSIEILLETRFSGLDLVGMEEETEETAAKLENVLFEKATSEV